jgi:ATP-dependent DNA ligase
MGIVSSYKKENSEQRQVLLSSSYSSHRHGDFSSEEMANIDWNLLKNLEPELAKSIATLVNAAHRMGVASTKKLIAEKLGLI